MPEVIETTKPCKVARTRTTPDGKVEQYEADDVLVELTDQSGEKVLDRAGNVALFTRDEAHRRIWAGDYTPAPKPQQAATPKGKE